MKILRPYQQKCFDQLKQRLKETTNPLLVNASVGSGKSLIIAQLLLYMEKSGYSALCLTMNSTLIQQNYEAYQLQGGIAGIYCASLKTKEPEQLIIFGSPQSVAQSIRNQDTIANKKFNLIIIDEVHNLAHHNSDSLYMRIINNYGRISQTFQFSFRVVGLTGTPWRGKSYIVGPDEFFKEEVCSISTSWLIQHGYLTKPIFGLTEAQGYDFSNIRVNTMGKFSGSELQAVIDSNARLTSLIMKELQEVMKNRKGAFIFAATRKHCEECAKSLPDGEWAIITGETKHEDRKFILENAKNGNIRYLISVNCLGVGIDVPLYDVCAWLRPTESLVLYTQGIGRVLRLHPDKTEAIILDYAGNLQRHGHIDDPIINEALQPREENEKEFIIPCLECASKGITTLNPVTARRCIRVVNNIRCSHFFDWKECPGCGGKNDITTRMCQHCGNELIDPNAKLSLKPAKPERVIFDVVSAKYWVMDSQHGPCFNGMYSLTNGLRIYESFTIRDFKMKNVFYGMVVRHQVNNPSYYYPMLHSFLHLHKMVESGDVRVPSQLECVHEKNRYIIKKRIFNEEFTDSNNPDLHGNADVNRLPETTI